MLLLARTAQGQTSVTITSLNPPAVTAGGPAFGLYVNGSGFASGAVVRWNGAPLTTTFASATQLTTNVPANLIAATDMAAVTVVSGGVTSNIVNFTIVPGPTISSLNPPAVTAGGPAFTLTVNGSGFAFFSGALVQWNGADRPTTFVSSTQLTAAIPATDIASPGTASVTVSTIGPAGRTSNAFSFMIATIRAVIPTQEREALIALYNSTNGANWNNRTGWLGAPGTECNWFGITCNADSSNVTTVSLLGNRLSGSIPMQLSNLTNVTSLDLGGNQLTGSIPTQLGNLTNLTYLNLGGNQLTGSIPMQLGNLTNLNFQLNLAGNRLSGSIPTQLGNLTNLRGLGLDRNQLTGSIPTQLGNLTNLEVLLLNGNQLGGTVPSQLGNLTRLWSGGGLDLRWNALRSSDNSLINFLNSRQLGGNWQNTQTIAPSGLSAMAQSNSSIQVSWSPIPYTSDSGRYQVLRSTTNGGPYIVAGSTANKSASALPMTGLNPATTYYFIIRTVTDPHTNNQNTVTSEDSAPVAATTQSVNVPSITSLNPPNTTAGGAGFILTVTGTNFVSNSVVRWNGADRPTTFGSSSQLTAAIPASDIATPGTASITVFNPGPSGGTSNALSFTIIEINLPTISALNPSSATAAGAAFPLTVTGTNFVSNSVVRWNGADRPTTFVSSTQLSAAIPASDIATAGTPTVTVFNPAPGGGTSNALSFTITASNPMPTITGLNPSSATAAGAAFSLTVTGTNFVSNSVVRWNGSDRTTTFVSSTQLSAAIPATDIDTVGTPSVTVFNPTPGGGTSNALSFTITATNPMPAITGLNPPSATAAGAAFTLTVTGTNFVANSVVRWNGADRPTTFGSSTQLMAAIPAGDIATTGTASVTVFNPSPGGGTSNALSFTITATNPMPAITALNPPSATAAGAAFTLTVTGTNFVSGSMVRWNGADRPTTFGSNTQLSAAIPAGDIATTGTASITVFNPSPGGGTSNALSFTITATNPMPAITGLNPSSATAAGAAFTLTVNGTNFISGSVVRWNGSDRTTTFVSSTQLTAAIPAGDVATAGTPSVTVFNPAPGGGTSNSQTFSILPSPVLLTIGGASDSVESLEQPSVNLTVPAPQSSILSGQLTLTFTPNAENASDDPAVQFVSGGRTVNFTIPANTTQGMFAGVPNVAFQTGSVAGTITLTVFLQGIANSSRTITINRRPPGISNLTIASRTATGFDLVIVGLSNVRALTQGTFLFTGSNLQTSLTADLNNVFTAWYQSDASRQYGSQFRLVVPVTVQGDMGVISSISVTLTNTVGASAARSVNF